jgi:hypothetical protein
VRHILHPSHTLNTRGETHQSQPERLGKRYNLLRDRIAGPI